MTSTPRFAYRHSGIRIASTIELPEWSSFLAGPTDAADVTIETTENPLAVAQVGTDIAFAIPDIGEWLIRDGSQIFLRPDPAADPAELRLFTLGSAWGALGYQRGWTMWHGSVVAFDGRAVLACGDSGAGKSTLAAALVAHGGTLVTDDLGRLEIVDGEVRVHPASCRLKLWGEAVDHLGWRDRVLHRDWLRADKFHCAVAENLAGTGPVTLAAIVVLADGEGPEAVRLYGAEALAAVLPATMYREEFIGELGQWPQQAVLAAHVLAKVPVWRLTRPRDLARLAASARLVEQLIR